VIAARWKLAAAVAVVSGALLGGRALRREPAPAQATAAEAPAARRQATEALTPALPGLSRQPPSPATAPVSTAAPDADEEVPQMTDEGMVSDAMIAAQLGSELQAEPVDPKWQEEMWLRANRFFGAATQKGASLRDLTCGSALCRAEIVLRDRAALDALVDEVSGLLPPGAEGYAYLESEADLEIEVYLSRLGPLPH
jgi:hypothetical protein